MPFRIAPWNEKWGRLSNFAAPFAPFGAGGPSGKHPGLGCCDVKNYNTRCYSHFVPCGATVTNGVWRCGNRQAKHLYSRARKRGPFDGGGLRLRLRASRHSAVGCTKARGASCSPPAFWEARSPGEARIGVSSCRNNGQSSRPIRLESPSFLRWTIEVAADVILPIVNRQSTIVNAITGVAPALDEAATEVGRSIAPVRTQREPPPWRGT